MRCCSRSDLERHQSRNGAAITSEGTGIASEIDQVSHSSQTTTACTLTLAEYPYQPLLLQHCSIMVLRVLVLGQERGHT